jgi:CRP/FNR family transcriptional regulator, cyclic AMP receptor protein
MSISPTTLRGLALFEDLPDELVADFERHAHIAEARRKQVVVAENETFPYLGILLSGLLYITVPPAGRDDSERRCGLYVIHPGETFAEFSLLDGEGVVGEIAALSVAEYALIPHALVRSWMERDFRFTDRIVRQATRHARRTFQTLMGNLTLPMLSRIASLLLPYAINGEGLCEAHPMLRRITQVQIAAMAGSVKEVVARTLADLEELGAIRREHGHIAYLDRDRLVELAGIEKQALG